MTLARASDSLGGSSTSASAGYDPRMPPVRIVILLLLAIPASLVGYFATAQVLTSMGMTEGIGAILLIFLPLLVAGLCALPFLAPFVDFKAKQALANAPSRMKAEPPEDKDAG